MNFIKSSRYQAMKRIELLSRVVLVKEGIYLMGIFLWL
ncbi:unnamed protein product [Linum tenue]|uniref:Uncharacterized protein n=1 Tax=Linum tenue TaxID=586396 RepID=A0AAV0KJW6_9ROSI|nr:unnamed protein product [Linum tenue]